MPNSLEEISQQFTTPVLTTWIQAPIRQSPYPTYTSDVRPTVYITRDYTSNEFMYQGHSIGEGYAAKDVHHLVEFYRMNDGRYNILPKLGSLEYSMMIGHTEIKEDDMALKQPDEFSWKIVPSKSRARCYDLIRPTSSAVLWRSELGAMYSLSEAYYAAKGYVSSMLSQDNTKAWNVHPVMYSVAYRALKAGISFDELQNSSKVSFMSIIEELDRGVKSAEDSAFASALSKLRVLAFIECSAVSNRVYDALFGYITSVHKVEYIAIPSSTGIGYGYAHPNNIIRVHTNGSVHKGSTVMTKEEYKNIGCECSGCNEKFTVRSLVALPNTRYNGKYCLDCLEELGYYRCSSGCAELHHEDDGCPAYTTSAFGIVHNYSRDVRRFIHKMYKTTKDRKNNGEFLRYGVELEVLPKNDRMLASWLCDKALRNHAILKDDSSLRTSSGERGFEIVTVPATLEYHRSVLWDNFFNKEEKVGSVVSTAANSVKSWNTGVCGIHVHITRAAMTDGQLSKLLVFYHEPANCDFLSRIAGRKVGPDAVYCKATKKRLGLKTREDSLSHHGAIALSNRNNGKTAEVRIFRGNVTYHGLMRCIEFVDATVAWCAQNSCSDVLDFKTFLTWFNKPDVKGQYPELKKFLIHLKYLTPRIKNATFKHLEEVPEHLRTA